MGEFGGPEIPWSPLVKRCVSQTWFCHNRRGRATAGEFEGDFSQELRDGTLAQERLDQSGDKV